MSSLPPDDSLFDAGLKVFVEERKALAKALRARGDKAGAKAVEALGKPTPSAWALNQVARQQAELLERYLTTQDAEAATQIEAGGREALFAAKDAHRRAQRAVIEAATARLIADGTNVTRALADRLSQTLQAAAMDPAGRTRLRAGRLVEDLDAADFSTLALLAASQGLQVEARERPAEPPAASPAAPPAAPAVAAPRLVAVPTPTPALVPSPAPVPSPVPVAETPRPPLEPTAAEVQAAVEAQRLTQAKLQAQRAAEQRAQAAREEAEREEQQRLEEDRILEQARKIAENRRLEKERREAARLAQAEQALAAVAEKRAEVAQAQQAVEQAVKLLDLAKLQHEQAREHLEQCQAELLVAEDVHRELVGGAANDG